MVRRMIFMLGRMLPDGPEDDSYAREDAARWSGV